MAKPQQATQRRGMKPATTTASINEEEVGHPGGKIKHGRAVQILRLIGVLLFFLLTCLSIVLTQFIGVPLYWINRGWYYAYMALTKQSFGIAVTVLTQYWSPTVVRISGDDSVAGQLIRTRDGRLECHFPDRLVMIANHQIYSDWLFLWWTAYTNKPYRHGHVYIMLKESLKNLPILGWGMQFYGFIFMRRKMDVDQPRMAHRMQVLKQVHSGFWSGSPSLDPMWLLLFPEGTTVTANTRKRSLFFAEKDGVADTTNTILPRSTGLYFCLSELTGTCDYIYDCTIAYEGIKKGTYGEDLYPLVAMYLQGRAPPSVNMHWRRFAIKDIPLGTKAEFDKWLRERWYEKDRLLDQYYLTGRFPGQKAATGGATPNGPEDKFIETEVKLASPLEIGNIYVVLATVALLVRLAFKAAYAATMANNVSEYKTIP